jgi:large subunit ribosomal protein L27
MAHKKAGSTSRNGRDSEGQRLGLKVSGGAQIKAGAIIIRQHGASFRAGSNVGMGRDYTLFAKAAGTVVFTGKKVNVQTG